MMSCRKQTVSQALVVSFRSNGPLRGCGRIAVKLLTVRLANPTTDEA